MASICLGLNVLRVVCVIILYKCLTIFQECIAYSIDTEQYELVIMPSSHLDHLVC